VLTLRRAPEEAFVLEVTEPGLVRVTVLKVDRKGRIILGVEAQDSTGVYREEVYVHVLRERTEAKG
jgi:sRNA-binding carbon storage regulator CsrA